MSNYKIKSMDIPESQTYMVAGTISFVPESEYKKILDENIELKKQINQYYDNERLLRETIQNNELTIEQLKKENEMLKIELSLLKQKIQEQDVIIQEQGVKIQEQDVIIQEQGVKIQEQDVIIKEQGVIIKEQGIKIQEQDVIIKEQGIKITNLENDVKELKERDIPITIREAMSILENHVMVEIVGSRRQANRYYGLNDLSQQANYKIIYEQYLQTNGISQDHVDLMLEFKKEGNKYAH
jgi:hypothetical protein